MFDESLQRRLVLFYHVYKILVGKIIMLDCYIWIMKFWTIHWTSVDQKKVENSSCIISRNILVYKVKVSKFSGDVRDYRKFKEQFQRYVHPLFCPSYLPFVLQSHLTNEIIAELDFINNSIDQIWDQLDNIYSTQKFIDIFGHNKPNSRRR